MWSSHFDIGLSILANRQLTIRRAVSTYSPFVETLIGAPCVLEDYQIDVGTVTWRIILWVIRLSNDLLAVALSHGIKGERTVVNLRAHAGMDEWSSTTNQH